MQDYICCRTRVSGPSFAAPFVLLASIVASAVGQSKLTVSVPDHTQCASTVITWENGVAPYQLLTWIEKDGAAAPVIVAGSLETTSHPFVNDAAAGFTVSIQLNDNNNDIAQLQYTIEPSSNSSCLPGAGW